MCRKLGVSECITCIRDSGWLMLTYVMSERMESAISLRHIRTECHCHAAKIRVSSVPAFGSIRIGIRIDYRRFSLLRDFFVTFSYVVGGSLGLNTISSNPNQQQRSIHVHINVKLPMLRLNHSESLHPRLGPRGGERSSTR